MLTVFAGGDHIRLEQLRQALAENPAEGSILLQIRQDAGALEAGETRAFYRALTYLGAMAQPDLASARADYLTLVREEPASPLVARLAPDRLEMSCVSCQGRGKVDAVCAVCNGSRKCRACGGARRLKGLSVNRPCPTCKGSGKCASCGRDGKIDMVCQRCWGKGKEFDRNEIRKSYVLMLQAEPDVISSGRWRRYFQEAEKGPNR